MPMSGKAMKRLFELHGWREVRQRGSHVMMGKDGQIETIPMHRELSRGLEFKLLKRLGVKR